MSSIFRDMENMQPVGTASSHHNLLPANGTVILLSGFFPAPLADHLFERLMSEVNWKQEPIWMFGKRIMQPRLTAWFGDPGITYRYSGVEMAGSTWTPALEEIKSQVESELKLQFNGALLNLYRDGQDSMGWHRDNEKTLGPDPVIASVSLGEARTFQLRDYSSKDNLVSVSLNHGSLLLMSGKTQQAWEHRLPKAPKLHLPRINITFRRILKS